MFGFFLALFGVGYIIVKLTSEHSYKKKSDREFDRSVRMKDEFILKVSPTPAEMIKASDISDVSDVRHEIDYILGNNRIYDCYNTQINLGGVKVRKEKFVCQIRLSKIGKLDCAFMGCGMFATANSPSRRFMETIAANLCDAGVKTKVTYKGHEQCPVANIAQLHYDFNI